MLVRVVVSNFSCWCLASGWKPRKGLAKAKNSPWLNVTIPNHEGWMEMFKFRQNRKYGGSKLFLLMVILSNLGTSYFILYFFVFNAFVLEADTNHKM